MTRVEIALPGQAGADAVALPVAQPLGGEGARLVDEKLGGRLTKLGESGELRGHGYATALTAEVSARRLAAGRRFCFLYTDLANPTSNAIYERIGYHRVCESAEYTFARA